MNFNIVGKRFGGGMNRTLPEEKLLSFMILRAMIDIDRYRDNVRDNKYTVKVLNGKKKTYTTGRMNKHRADHDNAIHWFNRVGIEPFSFRWCCSFLNVDPKSIRTAAITGAHEKLTSVGLYKIFYPERGPYD